MTFFPCASVAMPNRKGKKQKEEQSTAGSNRPPAQNGINRPPAQNGPNSKNKHNKAMIVAEKEPDVLFDRATLFTKTKMCKFHLVGICAKGSSCMYAHDQVELSALPDLFRTKLCKSLISSGQCDDPNCKYAHNKDELRSTSQLRKTKMCKFWLEGRCELGDCCSYAHDPSELNQPPPPTFPPQTMQVGFVPQRDSQAVPKSLASGGYSAPPQMTFQKASLPPTLPRRPSSEDVPSVDEQPRQVMVIDVKTGKPLVAGTMKTGDSNGSIQVLPGGLPMHTVDSGTAHGWSGLTQQELYTTNSSLQRSHHAQKELSELNPVKIGITTSNFWPNQNNLGQLGNGLSPSTSASSNLSALQVSPAPLRKVPSGGDHRPQPGALGQPKTGSLPSARNLSSQSLSSARNFSSHSLDGLGDTLADSPMRGTPLGTPQMRPISTPEFTGAVAPLDVWGCSDPMFASQLPVQLERMSGGDWVVRNTFVDTDEPLRNYPMRPVASCIGRFESLAEADEEKRAQF